MQNKTLKYTFSAMMAAFCCIATFLIHVPSANGGYLHLGDAFVILSGLLLGPLYGGLAAGIGSMLADVLGGYPSYAVATLLIKALAAVAAGCIFLLIKNKSNKKPLLIGFVVASGVAAAVIVVAGYFFFESLVLGMGFSASGNIPGNILQTLLGIIISTILYPILTQIKILQNI